MAKVFVGVPSKVGSSCKGGSAAGGQPPLNDTRLTIVMLHVAAGVSQVRHGFYLLVICFGG